VEAGEEARIDGLDGFADRGRERLRVAGRAHLKSADAVRLQRGQKHHRTHVPFHTEQLDVFYDANDRGGRRQRIDIRKVVSCERLVNHERAVRAPEIAEPIAETLLGVSRAKLLPPFPDGSGSLASK
jgi:hypothetical protein